MSETTTTEAPEGPPPPDGPLLDLTDAGVKKFIKQAKARGYVTMDELNKVLPFEEVTSEQIEDTLAMLSEMGVNVIEAEEDAPEGSEVAKHLFVPGFAGTESILLATGIIGATVMPHVVYLHSALTQRRIVGRDAAEKKRILGFEKVDVVIALSLAGLVNLSMMIVAAALFHSGGLTGVDSIDGAYEGLQQLVSNRAATVFGIALLASGFASSSVGTMAGQVVMQGFIRRRIPIFVRRAVTLAPALLVLAIGVDPTDALVGSQVVLSFGIPFALVPLLIIASKREIMGPMVNPRWLSVVAGLIASMIIALNVFLLYEVFLG